jgi:Cu-Zn family superoxide dismutase
MRRSSLLPVVLVAIAAGCSDAPERDALPDTTPATQATVHVSLAPTRGQTAAGMLVVTDTTNGIRITGRLSGLPADRRLGFHVHETGDCSAPDASSAGEHFNPTQQPHGDPSQTLSHAGDMPNLDVDAEGVADVDVTVDGVLIDAPAARSVRQRALVVHAAPDDYKTQPSGGSGDRIACGVIGADMGL